jgi:hypothetical protein
MAQSIESKTQLWTKRLRQFENSSLPELTLLRNLLRGHWNASGFMARELLVFKADLVFSSASRSQP